MSEGNGKTHFSAEDFLILEAITKSWQDKRWDGTVREYTAEDVLKRRSKVQDNYGIARHGAELLWHNMHHEPYVNAFGAITGGQAVEAVRAGLKAIYCSGWQVAAEMNDMNETYPDQSMYGPMSVPNLVKRFNNAFKRESEKDAAHNRNKNWFAPIIADAEAGFGSALHCYNLMQHMIEAGAAAVHFEDQDGAQKKCGHMGGKVLVPTSVFVQKLKAARLAADVLEVPTVLIARTDANSATLITNNCDEIDQKFIGQRVNEFYQVKGGLEAAIARGLSYAPYADMLWCETSKPDIGEAREFAQAIHEKYPGKLLAYNCSPSFNWEKNLSAQDIARFQPMLGEMGYKFQFITLAGWHLLKLATFEFALNYKDRGMSAYADVQREEFAMEKHGYTATKHQQEVGTEHFDGILQTVAGKNAATAALKGSTEEAQFYEKPEHERKHKPAEQELRGEL